MQTFGTRRSDVILHQDIQEGGPRHACNERDLKITQGHGRTQHLAQIPPEILQGTDPDQFWRPGEDAHQGQEQHDAEPEDRHR